MVSGVGVILAHLGEDQQRDGTAEGAQCAQLLGTAKAKARSA